MEQPSEDAKYLADTLAEAIRDGFSDLGDRIAQGIRAGIGTDPGNVNVSMSLRYIAESLHRIAGAGRVEPGRIENFGALRDGIYAMLAEVLPEPLTDDLFDVAVPENTEGPP